jgi:hypothetical protein
MNKFFAAVFILFLVFQIGFSQQLSQKYKDSKTSDNTVNSLILGSILVISPSLIIEDGKSYFGLSKEISLGKYPYGRAEFDYTFAFRQERKNMVHISYNLDIPANFNFNQPSLFMFSPGAGYYTDFTRKGIFAQVAFGLWASTGFSDFVSIHPNIKVRRTFMQDNQPGVFELSIGVGFGIYSR